MQVILYPLFALTIFMTVVFVKLGGAVPVRTLLLLALFGLLVLFHHRQFQYVVRRHANVMFLFAYIALLGIGHGVAQSEPPQKVVEEFLREIAQPLMLLISTYMMCLIVGVKRTAYVLMGVAALASVFAIGQYLQIGVFWKVREVISLFQYETIQNRQFIAAQDRAMGLGYTPILLSYVIIMWYIVSLILYHSKMISPRFYFLSLALIFASAFANETRSLLLGLLVSEVVRYLSGGGIRRYAVVALLAATMYTGLQVLEEMGSRLATVDDQSAMGRQVLYLFGLRVFLDNPLGMGWGFNPPDLAWLYWEHLTEFGKPEIVFRLELHNAILNFLLVYGVLGLVPLPFLMAARPKTALLFMFLFVGYFIHCFLHNGGYFVNELIGWASIAIFLHERDAGRLTWARHGHRQRPGARASPAYGGGVAAPAT